MSAVADAALVPLVIGSADGLQAAILPYGARLASLRVPSRLGHIDVVLGHDDPRAFARDPYFLGATVGRTSGRIARARFTLDGVEHRLPANEGQHHLHGGPRGFHAVPWQVLAHDAGARPSILLGLKSPDGDEGYPGAVEATALFAIEGDSLVIALAARTDAPTPVSLTNHAYYNLGGDLGRSVGDHLLCLAATHVLELDAEHIPTGRRLPVAGTPFDFTTPLRLDARANTACEQLRMAGGYDHTFVCDPDASWVARLVHEGSGLRLQLSANQPGLQVYAGHYLRPGPDVPWGRGSGLCLEPQQLPNAVNQRGFPSPVLRPADTYRNVSRLSFARLESGSRSSLAIHSA